MIRQAWFLVFAALAFLTPGMPGQERIAANGAVLFERYSFDSGLPYSDVSETTVPFTVTAPLGGRTLVTVSGGFTSIRLTGNEGSGFVDQEISGLVDTEARLTVELLPDRLNLLLTAAAPTGTEAFELEEGAVLSALSNEVIGFSTMNLGMGGRAGAGVVGAWPLGNMALGLAGSYTHSVAYSPVVGRPVEWKPGDEVRIRAGIEGTVAPETYLRIAGIFATRQEDEIDGEASGGLGNQLHAYVAVNHRIQASALTLYLANSYRSAPQVESTPVGAVRVPKGNILALGGKVEIPVTRVGRLIPTVEYRRLAEAPRDETGGGSLESAGSTLRLGSSFRLPIGSGTALVFEGSGLFGNVADPDGGDVGVSGFRGGLHLEVRR